MGQRWWVRERTPFPVWLRLHPWWVASHNEGRVSACEYYPWGRIFLSVVYFTPQERKELGFQSWTLLLPLGDAHTLWLEKLLKKGISRGLVQQGGAAEMKWKSWHIPQWHLLKPKILTSQEEEFLAARPNPSSGHSVSSFCYYFTVCYFPTWTVLT